MLHALYVLHAACDNTLNVVQTVFCECKIELVHTQTFTSFTFSEPGHSCICGRACIFPLYGVILHHEAQHGASVLWFTCSNNSIKVNNSIKALNWTWGERAASPRVAEAPLLSLSLRLQVKRISWAEQWAAPSSYLWWPWASPASPPPPGSSLRGGPGQTSPSHGSGGSSPAGKGRTRCSCGGENHRVGWGCSGDS